MWARLELRRGSRSFPATAPSFCDVQDAFLTVEQRDPTMIVAKDAVGHEQPYASGRVLPGQRAGSQLWNEDITNHLKQTLDLGYGRM